MAAKSFVRYTLDSSILIVLVFLAYAEALAIILSKSTGMSAFTQCEIKTFSLATHFLMNSMTLAGCCSAATPSAFKFCSAWLIALI